MTLNLEDSLVFSFDRSPITATQDLPRPLGYAGRRPKVSLPWYVVSRIFIGNILRRNLSECEIVARGSTRTNATHQPHRQMTSLEAD